MVMESVLGHLPDEPPADSMVMESVLGHLPDEPPADSMVMESVSCHRPPALRPMDSMVMESVLGHLPGDPIGGFHDHGIVASSLLTGPAAGIPCSLNPNLAPSMSG
jgi:hypothetical protein